MSILRVFFLDFGWSILRGFAISKAMKLRALLILAAANLFASPAFAQLTAADVTAIINQAVTRAVRISPNSVIAVTDREGYVLGVWVVAGGAVALGTLTTPASEAGPAAYFRRKQKG